MKARKHKKSMAAAPPGKLLGSSIPPGESSTSRSHVEVLLEGEDKEASFDTRAARLRAATTDAAILHRDYAPLPEKPGKGDWLAEHREGGQSVDAYARRCVSMFAKPSPKARNVLYVQPLGTRGGRLGPPQLRSTGSVGSTAEECSTFLRLLKKWLEAFFLGMQVEVLPYVDLGKLREEGGSGRSTGTGTSTERELEVRQRVNGDAPGDGHQLHAGDVIKKTLPRVRKGLRDAYALIGVTMEDLYPREEWNFVFGLAEMMGRNGVFSFTTSSSALFLSVAGLKKIVLRTRFSFFTDADYFLCESRTRRIQLPSADPTALPTIRKRTLEVEKFFTRPTLSTDATHSSSSPPHRRSTEMECQLNLPIRRNTHTENITPILVEYHYAASSKHIQTHPNSDPKIFSPSHASHRPPNIRKKFFHQPPFSTDLVCFGTHEPAA